MALRTFEFLRVEVAIADRFDLCAHQPEDLSSLPRRGAGVGREQPDLGELRVEAVRRVREPPLLADLLEESRRHPATERRVDDQEREPFRIRSRQAVRPDDDVRLLRLLPLHVLVPRGLRRSGRIAQPPRGAASGRELATGIHPLGEHPNQILVAHVAGRRDHELAGDVVTAVEAANGSARRRADPFSRPEDRPAERVARPQRSGEQIVDHILRGVVVHVDLGQDHLALGLEILGPDRRVLQHVSEMIDGQLQITVEHARVVAGVLLRREGVDIPADRIERLGDVERRARRGPLEQQMLEEMAVAADRGTLVPRSRENPETDRDGADAGHPLRHDPQPRAELGARDRHDAGVQPSWRAPPPSRNRRP